jgi:hypothetical protein
MDTAAVNRVFRAQHGVISLAQARTSGMSERQILHRVDLSQWLIEREHSSARSIWPIPVPVL